MFGFKLNKAFLLPVLGFMGWQHAKANMEIASLDCRDFLTDEQIVKLLETVLAQSSEIKSAWNAADSNERVDIVNFILDEYTKYCKHKSKHR